jgi:hypothetical protein
MRLRTIFPLFVFCIFGHLSSAQKNDSISVIVGSWVNYPNTKTDTLTFIPTDSIKGIKLNPTINWTFKEGGKVIIYEESSNKSTTKGVLDGKDQIDSTWSETIIINTDTIIEYYQTSHILVSGCSQTELIWSISLDNMKLTMTSSDKKNFVVTYHIVALTEKLLIVVEK